MKKWKQALALVLALVMALSLVALPSFAEGGETGGGTAAARRPLSLCGPLRALSTSAKKPSLWMERMASMRLP